MKVLGCWDLKTWDKVFSDGPVKPWSDHPIAGFLMYANDGNMAVSIYCCDRAKVHTTYCGRYEYREGMVIHHPAQGHLPGGIVRPKERFVKVVSQGQLEMVSDWLKEDGQKYRHRLVWQAI